ncbi:MAG TPA: ATP-binding protein [Acetobacteraceae bacterium]|nr:ATP-binding protein [Acetobacteraceae bacterium]
MLRWRLTLPAAAVALGLGLALTVVGLWEAKRIVSTAADQLVRHFVTDVSDDLGILLPRSDRVLSRLANDIGRYSIPLDDPRAVLRELYAVLTDEPNIDWLFFANEAGGVASAGRLQDGAKVFLLTDGFRAGTVRQFDASPDGQPGKLRRSSETLDARQKTWYQRAKEMQARYWTEPYLGSSEPVLGISLSAPVSGTDGRFAGVIGTDLVFTSLAKQLQALRLGYTGRVFIVDAGGHLIAASGGVQPVTQGPDGAQHRVAAADADDPVVRAAARYLLAQPGFLGRSTGAGVQSFAFDDPTLGRTYVATSVLQAPKEIAWTIVATVPASDFLQPTQSALLVALAISLAVIALTLILGYWLVARALRPLGALTRAAHSIARGQWREVPEIQRNDEVGLLARAFKRMTESLRDTQESLRRREEDYRSFFENAVEGILRTTPSGRVLNANPAAVRMLGYASEQEMTAEVTNMAEQVWSDRTAREAILSQLFAEGTLSGYETELTGKDGSRITVFCNSRFIRDSAGEPLYMETFLADITEPKRAEQALLDARAQLADAAHLTTLGEMSASIAHEVGQPLTALSVHARAGLRWIARQPPDLQEVRQSLEAIIKDSQRATEVIQRIRAWVKRFPSKQDLVDVNELIAEVAALTRNELSRHRIELQLQLGRDVPLVEGDRVEIQQVLINLVTNAIESIVAAGSAPRELGIGSGRDDSGDVLVSVRDSGQGLEPGQFARIFDAFYTTKPTGMGMGLRISRSIVEVHGGRLWAMANTPRGAVFCFTLPVRDKVAAPQQAGPSTQAR